jgi:phage shock protein PspC (stress-responsive transcriptional regulator)
MQRVVSIHLNGRAFQLEEDAHASLTEYLRRAEAALAANPDRAEIVGDLETAIGDKCAAYLSAHKHVVLGVEMARILEEMGPVNGAETEESAPGAEPPPPPGGDRAPPRRRLYRLRDGAWISGVSTGLAAYFDLDVTVVRVVWVIAAVFLNILAVFIYIIMMFVVPSAQTSEEWAAAHGVPFNAQGVIDEAKKRYSEFQARGGVRQFEWARRAERQWRQRDSHVYEPPAPPRAQPNYAVQIIAGLAAVLFGLVSAAVTIAFLVAVFSLATTGAILGFAPPLTAPIWIVLVALILIYAAIALPLRAIRHASFSALGGRRDRGDVFDSVLTLVLIGIMLWMAFHFIPDVHTAFNELIEWWRHVTVEVSP